MNIILLAILIVGGVGLFIGVFLGFASLKFNVKVDEKEAAVLDALPGNNCGGCGFPGCSGLAAAIAKGEAPVNQCPVGGEAVGDAVAKIMGVESTGSVKKVAFVACQGDCDKVGNDYDYTGTQNCRMLSFVPGQGPKSCDYGCLGNGDCVAACPFGAINVINGVAVVDKDKCKACGKCVAACPKKLISLIPYDAKFAVACSSKDKGPDAMKYCKSACIGCSLCVKTCPNDAVHVEDFIATIDQDKCVGCGACAQKCPRKSIIEH